MGIYRERNLGDCSDWVRSQDALRGHVERESEREVSVLVERAYEFAKSSQMPTDLRRSFYELLRDYCNNGTFYTADTRDRCYRELRAKLGI